MCATKFFALALDYGYPMADTRIGRYANGEMDMNLALSSEQAAALESVVAFNAKRMRKVALKATKRETAEWALNMVTQLDAILVLMGEAQQS